ncbi:MAG: UDP-N-acetylmuramoyl-L-alanine--D-glutamate ligase [Cyclobacteriaceae bacterium]
MSQKLVILGAGESGLGAAQLGKKLGYEVFLSDAGSLSEQTKSMLNNMAVSFEEKGHSSAKIFSADLVVKSPGIPDSIALILELHQRKIQVISEIEFAFRHKDAKSKVIAITGTNGKTTTTLLTYHLLKTAGFNVGLGGNIGVSFAKLICESTYDYYVIEVSSFQLDGIDRFKPDVAILLNITPDHLDRYNYNFQSYVSSKFRITENLTSNECFIYCADSESISEEIAKRQIDAQVFTISGTNKSGVTAYIDNDFLIFSHDKDLGKSHKIPVKETTLIGKHNMINAMAAILSAMNVGVAMSDILKGLSTFQNAPHRLELIESIEGIKFINDSKATNVDAVFYALDGINEPIIWVAGGVDKGNDYATLKTLVAQKVKLLICLGKNNTALKSAFGELVEVVESESLNEVVDLAMAKGVSGDVVLLSPACASFDLFKNYEDRGDQYKKAIRNRMSTIKVDA